MCIIVIRKALIYETVTYQKTDHPIYEAVTGGNELGDNVQLQENYLYGKYYYYTAACVHVLM